jgi:hypothetical protein
MGTATTFASFERKEGSPAMANGGQVERETKETD